jgi:hypothetical protein
MRTVVPYLSAERNKMSEPVLQVEAGSIVILRLYNIAYAADLGLVDEILRRDATAAAHRRQLTHAEPKAIAFDVPPVQFALGPITATIKSGEVSGYALARIYDFGVTSIGFRFPVSALPWPDFTTTTNELDRWAASAIAGESWSAMLERVRALVGPALLRPSDSELEEDYLLVMINRLNEKLNAAELMQRIDPVPLLTGDLQPLSPGARADLLRHTFSYFQNDLAILSWDRALIYEPTVDSDVADVLEVANAQLLELSQYDDRLNAELPGMYDRVARTRGALRAFARSRYSNLARDLYTFVAEVTETREKVDNALKVTEDVYIARIYSAALELFRIRSRAATVDRKLAIIRDTYQALYDEAATARSEVLTIAIVLLIVIEIVLSLTTR